MVLFGGGEPNAVIRRVIRFVAENEDNLLPNLVVNLVVKLVPNIDGEAAEHGTGPRRQGSDRVEHEFMGDGLALLDQEGVVQREEDRVATGLRHMRGESRSVYFNKN